MTTNEPTTMYAMVASGPPVRTWEVERPGAVVEVLVLWGLSVLDVAHVALPARGYELTAKALVGGGLDAAYAVLASTEPIAVSPDPAVTRTLEREALTFTFIVRQTPAGRPVGRGVWVSLGGLDGPMAFSLGGAVLLAAAFLGLFWLLPPNDHHLTLEVITAESHIASYLSVPAPVERATARSLGVDTLPGRDGKRADEERGQMGDARAPEGRRRSALSGLEDPAEIATANRARERAEAGQAGVLDVLSNATGAWHEPTSLYGRERAIGDEELSAVGAIMADHIGDSFGFGGLGVIGTGRGGGGAGLGTYGVTSIGGIGRGVCSCVESMEMEGGRGTVTGLASRGVRQPTHERPPAIEIPPPIRSDLEIAGSLSPEVIRRVVRRHTNEVRHCYEQVLATAPDLAGRVTVQFIVAPNGAVQSSAVVTARTDLGSQKVSSCVANTVTRWAFPQPDGGGIVSVTYPFVFSAS